MAGRRRSVEPTDDWQELLPLFWWPEQVVYERIRKPVLFGGSVAERTEETGVSESTLRCRIEGFRDYGMESLFSTETARRKKLPDPIRRLILDLKAEYPPFNLNEIANIVGACFGRKPEVRSVKRVLDMEAMPLKMERNYPLYYEMEDTAERRAAVVELRVDGWSVKAIAGYLGVHRSTVYRTLERFKEEGAAGLEDKPRGRPSGVRKVDLAAIEEVRKLAQNPQIGAFRVHAALNAFHEKADSVKGQRGGLEQLDRLNAPSCCVSIRSPSGPMKVGPVHDGIPPRRRCHLLLGLPQSGSHSSKRSRRDKASRALSVFSSLLSTQL